MTTNAEAKMTKTTMKDAEIEKLDQKIARLKMQLAGCFVQRAGRRYDKSTLAPGWGYCDCGRRKVAPSEPTTCVPAGQCPVTL